MKSRYVTNDALKAVVAQFVLVIILTPVVIGFGNLRLGGSFFLGGLICALANVYFYFRVFSHFGARAAKQIVNAFYRGEAVKIMLTAAAFYIAFTIGWVLPLWVFLGYIAAQMGFWYRLGIRAR